jgi:hypothetical protein
MSAKHEDAMHPEVQQAEAANKFDESLDKTPVQGKSAEEAKLMSVLLFMLCILILAMEQLTSSDRRRIDLRLLPILGVMYSISLIDRTNLGLAIVAGMDKDLELTVGNRYTIIVMLFFVTYM